MELIQGVTDRVLCYDRISVSKGIDADKTGNNVSKMYNICFSYFFKNKSFNYQTHVCNRCDSASQRATNVSEIKTVYYKNNNYRVVSNAACQ